MLHYEKKLKTRNIYLNQLIAFKDKEPVKVITGIRRCGKSSLLKLMQEYLLNSGVKQDQIIAINFESLEFQEMNYKELYEYVKKKIPTTKRAYLFFDELQRIERWEDAINSFRVDFDCDIYITGSNSYLLSSEYSTYLSGRYVEIKMYPLSFKEFIDFHGYKLKEYKTPIGEKRKRAVNENDEIVEIRDLFDAYMRYGGMPGIADVGLEQDKAMTLLDGVYSTVVVRDILEREKRRGLRQITDAELLRKIILFLADNIGNNTSLNSVSNTLVSENMIQNRERQGKPATQTIASYVGALKESYMFYDVKRFDIKGKEYLRTLGKYYIVDIGLRNYLLGFRDRDRGHSLENIVYFELLRRGFDVAIGKIDNLEVDFIATSANEKMYIQVTESMKNELVRERELKSLQKIHNNYKKMVITLDKALDDEYDGIQSIDVIEWLLK
ncbi:TPA: ATP-binding protein [Streptococcus pyogenes]|jgi:AAA+ superfamily ATPase|uniref:ATP-binding protein n=1 Tax=Bacillota TaxID=1239 RepID=UPI001CAB6A8D|nr:ATP-binding protein [[Eubacterium] sulci]UGQ08126.1 ATP-binding protein [Streptococcus anginosus]DAX71887.1 MAG TPA: putative ATPase [Caudoviricetes sp.]